LNLKNNFLFLFKNYTMAQEKIDLEKLKKMKSPLATVWEAMAMSNTARDRPPEFMDDVKIALHARDENTLIGRAMADLEARMKIREKLDKLSDQLNQAISSEESGEVK
jgi:hypothetical protein